MEAAGSGVVMTGLFLARHGAGVILKGGVRGETLRPRGIFRELSQIPAFVSLPAAVGRELPSGAAATKRPCLGDEARERMNRRMLLRVGLAGAAVGGGLLLRETVIWRPPEVVFEASDWVDGSGPRLGVPIVDAVIGGRTVRALIDSGAERSTLDRRLAETLGLGSGLDMPLIGWGVGGRPAMGRNVAVSLQVAGLKVERLNAAVLDLGEVADQAGLATPLILGQDLLSRIQLDLDLTTRRSGQPRLRFSPSGSAPDPGLTAIEVRRAGKGLKTPALIEGVRIEALVDTGSTAVLSLGGGVAKRVGLMDGRPQRPGVSLVLGGRVATRIVRVEDLRLTGLDHGRVDVGVHGTPWLPGFPSALAGMGSFAGRRVVLDLGAGALFASRPLDLIVG